MNEKGKLWLKIIAVAAVLVAVIAVVAIAAATVVMGWSLYWLGILLVLPAYFVLTIEMRF